MSHTIPNPEHHHFRNAQFYRPGSVHVHLFGAATLSFSEGIATQDGDIFEIEADAFRLPLHNSLRCNADGGCVTVQPAVSGPLRIGLVVMRASSYERAAASARSLASRWPMIWAG